MPRESLTIRIPLAALLLWTLLAAAGCQTGRTGWTIGPQTQEEIWAILCIELRGPKRFQLAEKYAQAFKQVPGLKANLVQVLSDEDRAAIYYGRYLRVYGGEEGGERYKPNPLRDLELIRSLQFEGSDVWPFILASMDMLPTYRSSHPEWDLTNVDGYWSLHVAVFYNTETMRSRRMAAEEYCRYLRQQGEEAYFHHAPARSSVYLGVYPFGAVAEMQRENALAGRVTTTMSIVDPDMSDAQKRFPISLHNGHKRFDIHRDPRTGEVKERTPTPSFPVIIPRAQRQRAALEER
ncbi:MAG: hypothetical protein KAY37_12985 [Phycisphaerae bacterium]|nr:hypothetical protein [Phycisphaerae bacterium]